MIRRYRCFSRFSIVINNSKTMGRKSRQNKKNPIPYENQRNYAQTSKDNELFLKYYSNLGVMSEYEAEWEFYQRMKDPLPVTFRITGYKNQSNELMKIIQTQFFDNLVGKATESEVEKSETPSEDDSKPKSEVQPSEAGDDPHFEKPKLTLEDIKPPKCLKWYPNELAWQLDLSRKAVRSTEILKKLHRFLVSETESGNISRQEAVSMIPPLILDVKPHSKVLDMCAAPGSKTAQLIEYLHADENSPVPEGFVVANDRENKRCYLMVHQVKRLSSPCCMIVNHDACQFPLLRTSLPDQKPEFMLFDRVLADVPCSGDGTMRKNIDIWKKWVPTMGNALHGLQVRIVKRGLELLEKGGRLVYSTCSMHPVEDEAVMAEVLRKCEGAVELVDVSSQLPGFKTTCGLSHWQLMSKQGEWIDNFEQVPKHLQGGAFNKSMFPPTVEEAKRFNLHLCHRVLPHHNDTGGFFFAALQKVGHLPWSKEARLERERIEEKLKDEQEVGGGEEAAAAGNGEAGENGASAPAAGQEGAQEADATRKRPADASRDGPQAKKKMLGGYKEDPFFFMKPDDPVWPPIKKFYGLPDEFPWGQLMYRSEQGAKRSLYFVAKALQQIVVCNENRVKFVNMGVKFVSRSPSPLVPDCDFRLTQESMGSLAGYLKLRTLTVSRQDAVTMFREENPFLDKMCQATQDTLRTMDPGSVVFVYKPTESDPSPACEITFCGWKGKASVRSFVARHDRAHCLHLFGLDVEEIKAEVEKKKQERDAATLDENDDSGKEIDEDKDVDLTDLKEAGNVKEEENEKEK